jgi:hypothetical protein
MKAEDVRNISMNVQQFNSNIELNKILLNIQIRAYDECKIFYQNGTIDSEIIQNLEFLGYRIGKVKESHGIFQQVTPIMW